MFGSMDSDSMQFMDGMDDFDMGAEMTEMDDRYMSELFGNMDATGFSFFDDIDDFDLGGQLETMDDGLMVSMLNGMDSDSMQFMDDLDGFDMGEVIVNIDDGHKNSLFSGMGIEDLRFFNAIDNFDLGTELSAMGDDYKTNILGGMTVDGLEFFDELEGFVAPDGWSPPSAEELAERERAEARALQEAEDDYGEFRPGDDGYEREQTDLAYARALREAEDDFEPGSAEGLDLQQELLRSYEETVRGLEEQQEQGALTGEALARAQDAENARVQADLEAASANQDGDHDVDLDSDSDSSDSPEDDYGEFRPGDDGYEREQTDLAYARALREAEDDFEPGSAEGLDLQQELLRSYEETVRGLEEQQEQGALTGEALARAQDAENARVQADLEAARAIQDGDHDVDPDSEDTPDTPPEQGALTGEALARVQDAENARVQADLEAARAIQDGDHDVDPDSEDEPVDEPVDESEQLFVSMSASIELVGVSSDNDLF